MKSLSLKLCAVASAASCVIICWVPCVIFFGWQRGTSGIVISDLVHRICFYRSIPYCASKGNSSCDYSIAINLSAVLANASPQLRLALIGIAGGREVLHLNAVQLRTAYAILGTDDFPLPENLTLSPEQVSGLLRLLSPTSQSILLGIASLS